MVIARALLCQCHGIIIASDLLCPAPRVGDIKRCCASDICLSVTYIGPMLRTETLRLKSCLLKAVCRHPARAVHMAPRAVMGRALLHFPAFAVDYKHVVELIIHLYDTKAVDVHVCTVGAVRRHSALALVITLHHAAVTDAGHTTHSANYSSARLPK